MTISIRTRAGIAAIALVMLAQGVGAAGDETGRIPFRKLDRSELLASPGGVQKVAREDVRRQIYHERWHQVHDLLGERHISARSLERLRARGLGPARLLGDPSATVAKAGQDTLKILLVRVSYETNRDPELVTLAADGDFFYEPRFPDDPGVPVDPEPHDRAFFESHLEGLRQYYAFQSGGRLHIDSRVLPEGDRDSYKLSDPADYGPGAGQFWTLEGLERFVRDMIATADAGASADGVSLADFDDDDDLTYIIFAHAGSDWQSDINQDSPNDVPTFFVTLGEPQPLASIDGETGATGLLSECSVIPETTTQDGFKGSIAAALYHEFGHALGLPDVYDAVSGYTACGVWDLMDSGTNLAANIGYEDPDTGEIVAEPVTGILPPSLSAWCKWFLGWVATDDVPGGEGAEVRLPAVGVPRSQYAFHDEVPGNDLDTAEPQVLLGGASRSEFFLVENRWVPWTVADTPYDDGEGLFFVDDDDTGVILFLGGVYEGQIYNTGYYDYFLPDGGLLVWHANMARIAAGLADNSINEFGDGLRVVEADGLQDIGVLNAYVLGWYGSASDVFAPWNTDGHDELFAEGAGVPTSRAFDRSWTGLRLWDIADDGDARGAVMRFRAGVEPLVAGWPADLPAAGIPQRPDPRGLDERSVTALRWDDGRDLIFAASRAAVDTSGAAVESPLLFAWTAAGAPAFPAPAGLPDGAVLSLSAPLTAPPVASTVPGTLESRLVIGTGDGAVHALGSTGDADIDMVWTADTDADTLLAGPLPVVHEMAGWQSVFVLDGDGRGHLLDADGADVGEPFALLGPGAGAPAAPVRVLPAASGQRRLLLVASDGLRLVTVDADGWLATDLIWMSRIVGAAEVATLPDGDDTRVIVWDETGLVGSWRVSAAGAVAEAGWPALDIPLAGEPAVADLDGDGRLDVVAVTAERIFAWDDRGTPLRGYPTLVANLFPLDEATSLAGPLAVADLAGGPGNELALLTSAGHLFLLGGDALPLAGTPLRCADGEAALLALPHDGGTSLAVASRGGVRGEPLERRLTHGRLLLVGEQPLGDGSSAGWYGAGGGSRRDGPVGTLQVVDDDGLPAAADHDVVYYPSPITGSTVTVRYWSATARAADLVIYDLAGEPVVRERLACEAGRYNEHTLDLDVASGLYVARLVHEAQAGRVSSTVKTLAVAR